MKSIDSSLLLDSNLLCQTVDKTVQIWLNTDGPVAEPPMFSISYKDEVIHSKVHVITMIHTLVALMNVSGEVPRIDPETALLKDLQKLYQRWMGYSDSIYNACSQELRNLLAVQGYKP